MTTITTTDVTNGTLTDASVMNANFGAIKTVVNGNIDNANISASAAIALSKLAQSGAITGQVMAWSGSAWAPTALTGGVLTRVSSLVSVTNTVTETDLINYTVVGNALSTDKMLRYTGMGDLLFNNNTADTLELKLSLGGTVLMEDSAAIHNTLGANVNPFLLEVWLANLGSASSQFGVLRVTWLAANVGGTAGTTGNGVGDIGQAVGGRHLGVDGTSSLDTTTDKAFQLAAQWSAASANNSLRMRYQILEIV